MLTSSRRSFLKNSALASTALLTFQPVDFLTSSGFTAPAGNIKIKEVGANFEREPLIRPFGFKGGYMTEIWQTAAFLESDEGNNGIGLCSQSVLWSDSAVFAAHSESGGNALMYAMTERAVQMLKGQSFRSPLELIDPMLEEVYAYGKKITANPDLRKTFALNALVAVDNAAWLLYARENGIGTFDEMIPEPYQSVLSERHEKVAAIPLMAYAIPVSEIESAVSQGYFFMKIKIGQPGTQEEMLEKDMKRLTEIHKAIGHFRTSYSKDGRIPYYFDANGRYEKKETLFKLLDHARSIGAFDRIALIEEPFAEETEMDVSDIPVRLAADESAHTDTDALKRIQMGYKAIALKAIAKTLSMTLRIAKTAQAHNVPCFCADLTVNPILVEWNKNVAARLPSFPGFANLGLLESNGHQNYKNWESMMDWHPRKNASWVHAGKGIYELGSEFYKTGGGIFDPIPHYENMFLKKTN
jgi:L-alanine-DL-glutamate epimerase-like enolase superfamily enzyme